MNSTLNNAARTNGAKAAGIRRRLAELEAELGMAWREIDRMTDGGPRRDRVRDADRTADQIGVLGDLLRRME